MVWLFFFFSLPPKKCRLLQPPNCFHPVFLYFCINFQLWMVCRSIDRLVDWQTKSLVSDVILSCLYALNIKYPQTTFPPFLFNKRVGSFMWAATGEGRIYLCVWSFTLWRFVPTGQFCIYFDKKAVSLQTYVLYCIFEIVFILNHVGVENVLMCNKSCNCFIHRSRNIFCLDLLQHQQHKKVDAELLQEMYSPHQCQCFLMLLYVDELKAAVLLSVVFCMAIRSVQKDVWPRWIQSHTLF